MFCKNKSCSNRRVFLEWANTHTRQISADHHTKEDWSKEELLILQDNLYDQVQKNSKIYVRREITPFVGIDVMTTHMTFILLTQVQEVRAGYGSEFC